jgi:hypothetical protein
MGRSLPVMSTSRAGQVECKWVGKSGQLPKYHDEAVIDHHNKGVNHVDQDVEAATSIKSTNPA